MRCRPRCSARPRTGWRIGGRAWLRHAKAGELCERFTQLHLVEGDRVTGDRADLPGRGKVVRLTGNGGPAARPQTAGGPVGGTRSRKSYLLRRSARNTT